MVVGIETAGNHLSAKADVREVRKLKGLKSHSKLARDYGVAKLKLLVIEMVKER
jgi:hypothetical protein